MTIWLYDYIYMTIWLYDYYPADLQSYSLYLFKGTQPIELQ